MSSNRIWSALTALVCAALLAGVIAVSVRNPTGQGYDQHAMNSLFGAHNSSQTIFSWLGYITAGTSLIALLVCCGIAIIRGRWQLAIVALVVVAGSNITTQVLKHRMIVRPDHGFGDLNSLPSGHTTVITSLIFAALLVVPLTLRSAVCFAGSLAISLVTGSMVTANWHRPSDVVSALLISLMWAALALAVTPTNAHYPGESLERAGRPPNVLTALAGAAIGAVILAVIGVRPRDGWQGLPEAFTVLAAISIAVAVVVAGFARLVSTRSRFF